MVGLEADPRLGGHFRGRFRMLSGSEHESYGAFLKFVPHERFAMSRVGGMEDPGESRVGVVLRAVAEGTFTHSRLDDENTAPSHEEGWMGALRKLERYCAAQ